MNKIVIVGAGGYAQELAWIIDDQNALKPTWDCIGYVDPARPERKGESLYDRPILGGFDALTSQAGELHFACGIGDPAARRKESLEAERRGFRPASLVHPTAIVARHVTIGPGSVIGAGSIIAPYATLGRHCAVNLHVTIGHNSLIGDYSVLSPGARVSGGAVLGERVFLGTNATVYLGRKIGEGASLGANSFLVTNLKPYRTAIGIPAKSFGEATGAGTCSQFEQSGR